MARPSTKPKAGTGVTRAKAAVPPEAGADDAPVAEVAEKAKAKEPQGPILRKKDFVERVLEAAGEVNKSHAKSVIDHTLAQILVALQKGETLAIAPLGKMRVASSTKKDDGDRLSVRIKLTGSTDEKS